MQFTKTDIGQRWCGIIIKNFTADWTLRPSWGRWIVIPVQEIYENDNNFVIDAHTTDYYEVTKTNPTVISGKALIVLVRRGDCGYVTVWTNDKIIFDRADLWTSPEGIMVQEDMPAIVKNTAIATSYGIEILSNEISLDKPRFILTSNYFPKGVKSSGIKSGQFIL